MGKPFDWNEEAHLVACNSGAATENWSPVKTGTFAEMIREFMELSPTEKSRHSITPPTVGWPAGALISDLYARDDFPLK